MKKQILSIIFIIGVVMLSNAQETKIGIKFGVGLSKFSGDLSLGKTIETDTETQKYQLYDRDNREMLSGFYFHQGISHNISFEVDLLVASKSAKIVFDEFNTQKMRYKYLSTPVFAKFNLSESINFKLGPQFNFLLDSEYDGMEDFALSFNVGVTYGMIDFWHIDLVYGYGLTSAYQESEATTHYLWLGIAYDIKLIKYVFFSNDHLFRPKNNRLFSPNHHRF